MGAKAKKEAKEKEPPNSLTKKFTAREKKEYVLKHLGLKTQAAMASHLECTEINIYQIVKKIRKERKEIINPELISEIAEAQFNRLNSNAQIRFADYVSEENRIQTLKKANQELEAQGKKPKTIDTEVLKDYFYMYGTAERQLTGFLKAIGHYHPDIKFTDKSVSLTQMNISVTADEARKEVLTYYGKKTAKRVDERMAEAEVIDIGSVEITENSEKPKKPEDEEEEDNGK